ncbi:MAG: hemin uptake protein HemP [Gammaproteobacteria bacterium]
MTQGTPPPPPRPAPTPSTIDASALLGNANEVIIEYRGQRYRLRATRQGKLILTK